MADSRNIFRSKTEVKGETPSWLEKIQPNELSFMEMVCTTADFIPYQIHQDRLIPISPVI